MGATEQFTILNIYNMMGQQVYSNKINIQNKINLDVSNIPDGIYFINVHAENYEVNKKVIICR